ncbi:DUF2482 family protein [Staphylococcus aureus]
MNYKEIKGESKFDILLFSSIGVIDRRLFSRFKFCDWSSFDLAFFLDSTKSYKDIVNVLQMCKSQKILGIDDDKED